MMKEIRIRCPLRPFSRLPGTKLLIPRTHWQLSAYPTLLRFVSLGKKEESEVEVAVDVGGFVDTFTVMQDLERSCLSIFGRSQAGYFSYRVVPDSRGIAVHLERCSDKGVSFCLDGKLFRLKRKERWAVPVQSESYLQSAREKLHFGCHKAQDWECVKRRFQLMEVLPMWFSLGQEMPSCSLEKGNFFDLLKRVETLVETRAQVEVGKALLELFRAAFDGILSPRSRDTEHWGFTSHDGNVKCGYPLTILGKGAELIRKLFVQVSGEKECTLFPCLPKELHAGRFIGVRLWPDVTLDLEWSKKRARRLILTAKKERTIELYFPSQEKTFRLRSSPKDRGKQLAVGTPITLEAGHRYFLDRFQK